MSSTIYNDGVRQKLNSYGHLLHQWHANKFGNLTKSIREVSKSLVNLNDVDPSDTIIEHRCAF